MENIFLDVHSTTGEIIDQTIYDNGESTTALPDDKYDTNCLP